jgi:hypothetical protein
VRPVLGLTTYLQQAQTGVWDVRASFLPAIYLDGVTLAGGIATLLPPQPVDDEIAARVLDGLDGLVIRPPTSPSAIVMHSNSRWCEVLWRDGCRYSASAAGPRC